MRAWTWMPFALALLLATSASASNPRADERAADEAAARSDLAALAATLADPRAPERSSAAHALVNLVSRQLVPLAEGLSYLAPLARDPDPEIARLAATASEGLRARAERLAGGERDTRPESECRRVAAERELEALADALLDFRSPERVSALRGIGRLASTSLIAPEEVSGLLEWARSDQDPRVAHEAEVMLARVEGRPVAAHPAEISVAPPLETRLAPDDPVPEQLMRLSDPDARIRYGALVELMDIAQDAHTLHMSEIIHGFQQAATDPDPRVGSYAEVGLNGGLAGEVNAVHQVYVGQASAAIGGQPQPAPTMADAGARLHQGHLDAYGVFIGIPDRSAGGEQPPPATVVTTMSEQEGRLDAYGVFRGVSEGPPGRGEQQP